MNDYHLSLLNIKDLQDMRLFITKKGRPTKALTNSIWQRIFYQLKIGTIPYIDGEKKHMSAITSRAVLDEWGDFPIDQTTDYKRYCMFINQALREIRQGKVTYCYYYYQIAQLLKFHQTKLRSRYNELGHYWEVWLVRRDNG